MPRHTPRYVETRLGILTYAEFAPHLARNVLVLERRIESGDFSQSLLDDSLLLQFQRLLCGDLVPQLAGWRRTNVTVGAHAAPEFFRVPALVREYGLDLQARLERLPIGRGLTFSAAIRRGLIEAVIVLSVRVNLVEDRLAQVAFFLRCGSSPWRARFCPRF